MLLSLCLGDRMDQALPSPPTPRHLQKRAGFLTPLCLRGEDLASGAQGLAVMQAPNPNQRRWPGFQEQPTSASAGSQSPTLDTRRLAALPWRCSEPQICRPQVFGPEGGSCPRPWAADPFSRCRPQCWLGCPLGTRVHMRACLGLPIPGPASPAAPPSLPGTLPSHPYSPSPGLETLESPSALPSPSRFTSDLSPSPPAQAYL